MKTILIAAVLTLGSISTANAGGVLTGNTVIGDVRFCTYNGYSGGYVITVPAHTFCPLNG